MMRRFQLVVVLLAITSCAFASDVIDRIVATVNGHIILQSDWDESISYEALTGGKPLHQLSDADRKATLERLIDQELLQEQFQTAAEGGDTQYRPDDQLLNVRIQDVRRQFREAGSDQGWRDLLSRYGFTEQAFKQRVVRELEILHMVEDRIAPTVQVDNKSVEDYYSGTLLPQLRKFGAKEPALADVAPKIHELLVQQKLNEALKEFVQNLRDAGTIRLQITTPDGSEPH